MGDLIEYDRWQYIKPINLHDINPNSSVVNVTVHILLHNVLQHVLSSVWCLVICLVQLSADASRICRSLPRKMTEDVFLSAQSCSDIITEWCYSSVCALWVKDFHINIYTMMRWGQYQFRYRACIKSSDIFSGHILCFFSQYCSSGKLNTVVW